MDLAKVGRPRLRWAPVRIGAPIVLLLLAACVLGCGAAPPPLTAMSVSWDCGEIIGDPERDLLEAVECEQDHWRDHYAENYGIEGVDEVTLDPAVEGWIADALTEFARARPSPASREAIQRLVSDADLGAPEGESGEVAGLIVGKTIVSDPPMLVDVIPECREGGCYVSVRPHAPHPSDDPVLTEGDLGSHRLWVQECELCLPRARVAMYEAYWRAARIGDFVGFDRRSARKQVCGPDWLDLDPEECPFPVES